jgi:hypothetical protein
MREMRYIKLYESFSPEIGIAGAFIWGAVYNLIKYGSKYIFDKQKRNSLIDLIKKSHAKSYNNWEIKEIGDIIELRNPTRPGLVTSEDGLKFRIHKSSRRIEYISNVFPVDTKLPKGEFDKIISGIEFVKQMSDNFEDFAVMISDNDFEIKVTDFDFYQKSFTVQVYKDRNLSVFNIEDVISDLTKIYTMMKSMYGVEMSSIEDRRFIDFYMGSEERFGPSIFILKEGIYKKKLVSDELEKIDSLNLDYHKKIRSSIGSDPLIGDLKCKCIYIKFIQKI